MCLTSSGNGDYYTGYGLLNGSNSKVGGFCAEGSIRVIGNRKYRVITTFAFNDIIDANNKYSTDIKLKNLLKKSSIIQVSRN